RIINFENEVVISKDLNKENERKFDCAINEKHPHGKIWNETKLAQQYATPNYNFINNYDPRGIAAIPRYSLNSPTYVRLYEIENNELLKDYLYAKTWKGKLQIDKPIIVKLNENQNEISEIKRGLDKVVVSPTSLLKAYKNIEEEFE